MMCASNSRENHPGAQLPREPRRRAVALYETEDLIHPLVNDVRQQLPRNLSVALRDSAWQLNDVRRIDERLIRAAIALLEPLRVGLRDTQPVHDIARHVVSAERDRPQVADLPLVKDGEIRGSRPHLHERDTE